LREVQRKLERVQHESAVGGARFALLEPGDVPAAPFHARHGQLGLRCLVGVKRRQLEHYAGHIGRRVEARTVSDETDLRRQPARFAKQLGHELGTDTRRIAGDEGDGRGHSSLIPVSRISFP
jgi:hypothetical protein